MIVDEPTAPTLPASAAASTARWVEPPRRLGRYTVLELIGRGGMGDVYLGLDEQLARHVAIKLLGGRFDQPDERDRLRREAVALAQLAHPNVVTIHEVGEAAGQVYLVMERVQGVTLRAWLAAGPRTVDEIVAVMQQAGKGLAAAHSAGLIHRDFKPDNVMVDGDGRVRVMDFGLACAVDDDHETTLSSGVQRLQGGTLTSGGTPGYMAPEQYLGASQDARCDIFGFCVTLFEALHGRRPFAGDSPYEVQQEVLGGRITATRADRVPAWLDAVVRRGLLGSRGLRWQTMDALLAALGRGPPVLARRAVAVVLGLAAAVLTVVAVVAGGGALRQTRAERLAEERLGAAELAIRRAEAEGAGSVAEGTFQSFVTDPAHRGTRALVRAWRHRGDQRRAEGLDDAALHAYGWAYISADTPDDAAAVMHTMAEMFRARRDGPALAQALATLQARGLALPEDAELGLDAALLRGDLAAAAAAARAQGGADRWGGLLTTLASGRAAGLRAAEMVTLPGGTPGAFVAKDTSGYEAVLLDGSLAPVGRVGGAGRHLGLVRDAAWVVATGDGEAELIDLTAPGRPLWRGPSAGVSYRAGAFDIDGDGAQDLVFGRVWPELGFRGLTRLGGPAARERAADAATDASGSEVAALWQGDLDEDGAPELIAAIGPWHAFDLRVFRAGDERLELVARRRVGRVTGLGSLRRGDEQLLVVLSDESCPSRELFPEPPHTGEPAGARLLRWDGEALEDVELVPLPRSSAGPVSGGRTIVAADLDGDAVEELALALGHGDTGVTWLLRQEAAGMVARTIHGMRPLAAAQLDEDPARELVVQLADEAVWALGIGDRPLPAQRASAAPRRAAPALGDPLLVERWARADELAGVGLPAPAAASLTEIVGFTNDPQVRRALLDHAADLLVRAGDDAGAVAVTARAELPPDAAALARDAAALARLGRHVQAHAAAEALLAHTDASPAVRAEAERLRERLAPLVDGAARVDIDFAAPLDPAWQVRRPASLQRNRGRGALELTIAAEPEPAATLPLAWDGGPIALEAELDLRRIEPGACLRVGIVDGDGEYWLGAGVCALGGGGRLLLVERCKLAGTGWLEFPEEPVPSAATARHIDVRVAVFADGTAECSVGDGPRRGRLVHGGALLPLREPLALAIGAFEDHGSPALAVGSLRRVAVTGARAAPAERSRRADAARLLVEGEPAAALDAIDGAVVGEPRDGLLRVLAYDELYAPAGLTAAVPELLPHLRDAGRQAELAVLLRTRPMVAMALYQAAGPRLLPTLALAWAGLRLHAHDPEVQRLALAELGGIDTLRPEQPDERLALRRLLALRAGMRVQLGEPRQARRDFEAALAVPASELDEDVDARVDIHIQLVRLLVGEDPRAAAHHAAVAQTISATPELIRERLAAIDGAR